MKKLYRGLNIKSFGKLIDGGLPPHRQMELDIKNFFLAPLGNNMYRFYVMKI